MREIQGESRTACGTTLHLRTPRAKNSKPTKTRTPPTTAAAHMDGPLRRASARAYYSHASPDALMTTESQDEPASRRHRPNTPAGELGLGLQDNGITAAAWDVPILPDTNPGLAYAMESVVDSIDSNNNIYVEYHNVHEYEDTDTGPSGVENPEVPWAVGIGYVTDVARPTWTRSGPILSLGSE